MFNIHSGHIAVTVLLTSYVVTLADLAWKNLSNVETQLPVAQCCPMLPNFAQCCPPTFLWYQWKGPDIGHSAVF